MTKRLVVIAFTAAGLMACGPGAKIGGGKQGAAEALLAASGPTKAGSDRASTPVDVTANLSFKCPQGGTAELTAFHINVGVGVGANVSQEFTLNYKNCGLANSSAGVAVYNGSLTVAQQVIAASGSASVDQSFKGKVLVQGAFDDFLNADVVQKVAVTALAGSGQVSMTLKGTVETSSGSYTFDEAVNVTGSSITAEVKTK